MPRKGEMEPKRKSPLEGHLEKLVKKSKQRKGKKISVRAFRKLYFEKLVLPEMITTIHSGKKRSRLYESLKNFEVIKEELINNSNFWKFLEETGEKAKQRNFKEHIRRYNEFVKSLDSKPDPSFFAADLILHVSGKIMEKGAKAVNPLDLAIAAKIASEAGGELWPLKESKPRRIESALEKHKTKLPPDVAEAVFQEVMALKNKVRRAVEEAKKEREKSKEKE